MVEPESVDTDGGMQSILSVHVARNRFGCKPRVSGVALVCLACLIRGSWCVVIRLLAIISYLTISDVRRGIPRYEWRLAANRLANTTLNHMKRRPP